MKKHSLFIILSACLIILYYVSNFSIRLLKFGDDGGETELAELFLKWRADKSNETSGMNIWPSGEPMPRLKFKTCAYVTGAGHLLHSNLGNEIDQHDCVIRSNDAAVRGYEKDVGRKTTMRTVDRRSLQFILQELNSYWFSFDKSILRRTLLVMIHSGTNTDIMAKFQKDWPTVHLAEYTKEKYRQVEDEFVKHINQSGLWISNAFFTLILARDMCEEIDVYGISGPEYCSSKLVKGEKVAGDVPYHYYENSAGECQIFFRHSKKNSDAHWYLREKLVFRTWMKEWDNLRFFCPEWT